MIPPASLVQRQHRRVGTDRLDERLVRNPHVLEAGAQQHSGARTTNLSGQLGDEAGLADPGRSLYDRHEEQPLLGSAPQAAELVHLPVAADEAFGVGQQRQRSW